MSENKFIAKLKGEPTPKSVVEIQNDRLVAPFKSSPMGHIADRDSSVVVAKGAQNWAVNREQLVPVADDYAGTESDLTTTSRVSGAGLWLNATYTFPQTGNEKNPVSAIIAPSAKWVLTLCGDSLFTNSGNSITLTMIVKIGASHISTKSFRISEQASQFSKRMAIDFSESEQSVIKALGGSPLTVQVLCDDEGASATIYGGMTHLTLLQRKVDADLVSTDNILLPEFIETLLEGYIIPEDYFNRYEYLDQIQDGGKAMPEFTRTGDKVEFTGWAKPATEVYSKTEIDDKFTVTNAQIDANADAIQKTREDFISADSEIHTILNAQATELATHRNDIDGLGEQVATIESKVPADTTDENLLVNNSGLLAKEQEIRADINEEDSKLQAQITAHAEAITTLQNDLDELGDQVSGIESKIPDGTSETNPLINKQQLLDEEMDIRSDFNESISELQTQITAQAGAIAGLENEKLDKEYASDFRGEWPNYASVPSDSNAYPADTLGSYIPNFNDYIIVKDSGDYFVASSKNLLKADVVGAVIPSTPSATFIVNYDVWYLGVAYNGYMGSNVPLATFQSGVGTISFISNSADSYGVCRFVRLNPNTTYTISAKNGGKCAIATLTDEGGGYSKFSTQIKTPTSLPITFTTNDNSTYGIVLYANSNGTECKFEEIQLEIGSVATSYETSGGYYLEGTWRFRYAGTWDTNNKAGWIPEYALASSASGLTSVATDDTITGDGTPDNPLSVADALASKADDSSVVHTTGNENIGGVKNITESLKFFAGENDSFAGFMYKQPSTGNLVLGNRVEGNTDWMSVLTFGVDGSVKIKAVNPNDISTNKVLLMNHDGSITWGGIPVICAKTRVPTGSTYTWYIELSNGLVLQGGRTSGSWSIGSGQEVVPSVTLPIAVDTGHSFAFFQPKEIYCMTIGYYFNSSTNVRPRFGAYTTNRTLSSFDWMVIGKKA